MKQKYITINSIKLSYFEQNENKENTLFFIHGNSISARFWEKQMLSAKLNQYRLIALDLPAHGSSSASPEPEKDYTLKGLAGILAKVIKILVAEKHFVMIGLSLGTNIAAETLGFGLKPQGIVLLGSCLLGEYIEVANFVKPNTHVSVVFTDGVIKADVIKYSKEIMKNTDERNYLNFINDYFAVRPQFRSVLGNCLANTDYSDEIGLLKKLNIPLLVAFGKDERIIEPDYLDNAGLLIWKNTIFKLSRAGHLVNIDQPEKINDLIKKYADDVLNLDV